MFTNALSTVTLAAIATSQVSAEINENGEFVPGPVLVIHGMNSACPFSPWTEAIAESIDYKAVVKCLEVGDGITSSLFERNEYQTAKLCQKLHNDPDFVGKEISLVGMSQGGITARALV